MLNAAEALRGSLPVWSLLSVLDSLLAISGCAMLSYVFFRIPVRRKPLPWIVCAALVVAFAAAEPAALRVDSDGFAVIWSALGLILPFGAMALMFRGKGLWKPMLAVAGYSFVEGACFVIVMAVFGFDYTDRNDTLELLVRVAVDVLFFGAALFLFTRRLNRRSATLNVTGTGVALYLMVVLSFSVFISTLLIIGPSISATKRVEYLLLLLNIPVISATVAFAFIRFFRVKNESENYKRQLQMQIAQFERIESVMEDVRIFRHDLPKKMRPIVAYLDADRPDEAKRIAEQIGDLAVKIGDRFHTGNYRLDTVLSFEQQLADRDGTKIDVSFDSAFPADGIDPDDVYTIFPNALDNAIEACRALPEEKRVITFRSRMDARTVFVTIRNPLLGEIRTKNGLPQTSKADKASHGYGFRSIRKAASKYGEDNVSFITENGVFELRLFLDYRTAGENAGENK